MTNWLVTTPVEGEGSFITDDPGILALAERIIRLSDYTQDGEEYIIRKADYLNTKPLANPSRTRLTLVHSV